MPLQAKDSQWFHFANFSWKHSTMGSQKAKKVMVEEGTFVELLESDLLSNLSKSRLLGINVLADGLTSYLEIIECITQNWPNMLLFNLLAFGDSKKYDFETWKH